MTRLKQQEEQRLREFQKVAEEQQQRKRQREREQQALREPKKRRAQQSGHDTPPAPCPEPETVTPPVPPELPAQPNRQPGEELRPVRLHFIGPVLIFIMLLLFVVYILYLQ